ncbi:MAG TPA: class I SAM-dependent methyltransferase [Acidimicrobiia bacterium]|nr:class I SAM-dependent methyltransferase [Acidimicrobiia bacterium]
MFYGPDQARIHHDAFGSLAREAAGALVGLLHAAGLTRGTVVDLGCGSGILAAAMCDAGYDVTGVDISPAMVELARATAPRATFRVGSLLDAPLPRCVAVTAIGEALNYATDERAGREAVRSLAARVYDALEPGGVFLFDVATPGRHGPDRRRAVFHRHDTWCLGMHAEESEDGTTLDRRITIFTRADGGTYRRTDEHHVLRLYEPDPLAALLRDAGFDVAVRDRYVDDPAPTTPPGGWHVFVARKPT